MKLNYGQESSRIKEKKYQIGQSNLEKPLSRRSYFRIRDEMRKNYPNLFSNADFEDEIL